jgi:hypothetical protein
LTLNFGSDPAYNFADAIVESLQQYAPVIDNWQSFPIFHSLQQYLSPEMADVLK